MAKRVIIIDFDNTEIIGAFLRRQQHFLELEIQEPYTNWTISVGRKGQAMTSSLWGSGSMSIEIDFSFSSGNSTKLCRI